MQHLVQKGQQRQFFVKFGIAGMRKPLSRLSETDADAEMDLGGVGQASWGPFFLFFFFFKTSV